MSHCKFSVEIRSSGGTDIFVRGGTWTDFGNELSQRDDWEIQHIGVYDQCIPGFRIELGDLAVSGSDIFVTNFLSGTIGGNTRRRARRWRRHWHAG